ncbi:MULTISPECIES: DUF6157 family protein [unclassified Rathayibacter]|uniref:DUF6157 family protein n=1 Tax=unclassified Rathayibacter TaxID=2609250 RepID=UPI0006F314E0|nr:MULTISPECIES: DUF6157 family protein [unclassified Rathayibacter]KQQ00022.1 hypothetical protein ASF42_16705 [Rathayibacter sp. Leaf294]KQS09476.1 hypothetical protein ASG06_16705 [Rathayibacter sp. Leaf185]
MTTDYFSTFIAVAADCPVATAAVPPDGAKPTVASLQYALLHERPYELTSDDVLFTVHALRSGIPDDERDAERERFFARDQPCLRASPLPKRYGWGLHYDAEGRVALVGAGTPLYDELLSRSDLVQKAAMRSSRR